MKKSQENKSIIYCILKNLINISNAEVDKIEIKDINAKLRELMQDELNGINGIN